MRQAANSSAQGVMSIITSAASVAFALFAVGALVQFALKWPFLPQRKQIGEGRLDPAGLSGLPHCGKFDFRNTFWFRSGFYVVVVFGRFVLIP